METAHDGEEGVIKALAGSHDVVLMDIQMPKVDGYHAIRMLANSGYSKPVIALTAHAMKEERIKTKAHGFHAHITKPIDATELIQAITAAIARVATG